MAVHRDSKVSFYTVVAQQAKVRKSLYVGNATDKSNLVDFMEMNGWFGVDVHICGEKQADIDRGGVLPGCRGDWQADGKYLSVAGCLWKERCREAGSACRLWGRKISRYNVKVC